MNGFTTTETDATEADLATQAERVAMALAEAGFPGRVAVCRGVLAVRWDDRIGYSVDTEPFSRAWLRALALVGRPGRCWPCHRTQPKYGSARVSPDCEGTGRCQLAEDDA